MDKKQELLELLKEANKEMFEKAQESSDQLKEAVEALKAESSEMKAKIESIENAPAKEVTLPVPGTTKTVDLMYKKHYVPGQGAKLKLHHTPEKQEVLAKGYIDFVQNILKNGQASLKTAMNEGTPGEGGYLVFDEYVNELLAFARLQSFALQKCRVIDVASDVIHIPAEDTSVSVAWKAETVAAGASDPTVTEVKLEPERLTAYSTASNEFLADSAIDVVSWLTDLFSEAIGQELDDQVINGDASASDPFTGLANDANVVDSTGTLDLAHLTDALSKLAPNKVAGAEFLFHRLVYYPYIVGAKDTAGNAIYPPTVATPNALWGFPVFMSEKAPYTLTNGSTVGYLGNFNNYIIARRMAAGSLDVDIYGKFLEYQTRFRTVSRWHGKPWSGSAFVKLVY